MNEYSVLAFTRMIEDKERITAYYDSLKRLITPDSVVLDIGAGTGVFSILSALMGAKKIYAVEPNDAIQVAMDLAKVNGVTDRIEFFQDVTQNLSFPEKADIIIADIHGTLPFYGNLVSTFADANERLLKPGGHVLPSRDEMYVLPITSDDYHRGQDLTWAKANLPINWSGIEQYNFNTITAFKSGNKTFESVFQPQKWANLDYQQMRANDVLRHEGRLTWVCEQPNQQIDGYLLWFDSILLDDIRLSNHPGSTPLVYGHVYLPLMESVNLTKGQELGLELRNTGVNQNIEWHWNTIIGATENQPERKLRQSTLYSKPITLQSLKRSRPDQAFKLSDTGRLTMDVLGKLDLGWPLGKVAAYLHNQFPERFKSPHHALDFISPIISSHAEAKS